MLDRVQQQLEPILDRQGRLWRAGRRPAVAELLERSPLRHDTDAQLDLIYNEIVLREDLGEVPTFEEYVAQFPHLREELALQFEVHGAMATDAAETPRLTDATRPDLEPPFGDELPDVPGYEVVEVLGRGGMGVVYKARDRRLRRPVALKMFDPGRTPSPREVLRFRAEAAAIARLRHPNVVQIYEIGDHRGLPFLALELADRGTLAHRLQRLPYPPRPAAELVAALARAADHVHANGIVHRDLKPANILFAADTPKLTDFGLAKLLVEDPDAARDATRTGEPVGTPRYMAPEQTTGRHELTGPATDVYALGTILYECLTGQVPFVAASVVETVEKIRFAEPVPPRRFQKVTRNLETICLKCLEKQPERRYATAAALADDLDRYLRGEPIAARPVGAAERAVRWTRRYPTRAALIGTAAAILVAAGVGWKIREGRERERIAEVRASVESLVRDGQDALARREDVLAESRFQQALVAVQGEPALADYRTGVAGWLNHSRQLLHREQWKQRVPPREFDDLRDEAVAQSVLLDRLGRAPIPTAREAVAIALDRTLPGDPAWQPPREQLAILDADLIALADGPAAALARLDPVPTGSRLGHLRRAAYLDELGRHDAATAEREQAAALPPNDADEHFHDGLARLRRGDAAGASTAFEAVLDAEPEHFAARLCQAVCVLKLGRPGEAKVGLTACVAQRPRFAWCYLLRAECHRQLAAADAARKDIRAGLDLRPAEALRLAFLAANGQGGPK
ncbi:serine/threonine-protein kinase [Limnoglobus roseus]|uniref:Tetratricopeptide repeat protein n=1 Tax=Limnoglobus roseus TaxID=2598579 RepID=A0A5C1AG82_9BACT|nr:serine/threonine-protein kinase [Limnoglobus roseus]QEL16752.1 tetratricopeptide repeat protein [Limnoglobus roseus]